MCVCWFKDLLFLLFFNHVSENQDKSPLFLDFWKRDSLIEVPPCHIRHLLGRPCSQVDKQTI